MYKFRPFPSIDESTWECEEYVMFIIMGHKLSPLCFSKNVNTVYYQARAILGNEVTSSFISHLIYYPISIQIKS